MNWKKKPLIYVCLAGVGQGNASRLEALWQELKDDVELKIFCWGKSYDYLSLRFKEDNKVEINQLKSFKLSHSEGSLKFFEVFWEIPTLLYTYLVNSLFILKHMRGNKPDLSIHDSDYHLFPFMFYRVKRVAISQTPMIVANRKLLKGCGVKIWLNFFLYEYSEYLFMRSMANLILCPSFDKKLISKMSNLKIINPIVRREFREISYNPAQGLVVATGASGIGSQELINIARTYGASELVAKDGKNYEAIDDGGKPVLSYHQGAIVQSGNILISECLSLGIPFYPIAIDDHPEQFINKEIIARDFYPQIKNSLANFVSSLREHGVSRRFLDCSGAKEASGAIRSLLPQKNFEFTADDWGMNKYINEAILDLAKEGKIQVVSIMVNQEHITYLLDELLKTKVKFSLHFNVTEGKPLKPPSDVGSLMRSDGRFMGPILFFSKYLTFQVLREEMALELNAQLERAYELVGERLKELDGHHHVHLAPRFISLAETELMHYDVPYIRCPEDKTHLGSFLGGFFLRRMLNRNSSLKILSYGYLNLSSANYLNFQRVITHPGLDPDSSNYWSRRRYQEYLFLKNQ